MSNLAIISGAVAVAIVATFYVLRTMAAPKNIFIAWDPTRPSAQPRKVRSASGPFHVKVGKKRVTFPSLEGYGAPRQDGKGTIWIGDVTTGQLIRPEADGSWKAVHGIYLEEALADTRVAKVVQATSGKGVKLEHILIALGIVMVLIVGNIYQYARGG